MTPQKPQRRKSIIPYTTTCPYWGHRVLPKNLERHIRSEHPDMASTDKFLRQIQNGLPKYCPYCGRKVHLHELENHVIDNHPEQFKSGEQRANAKVKKEEAERKRKLERVAKEYDAPIAHEVEYDSDAPLEWQLAREVS